MGGLLASKLKESKITEQYLGNKDIVRAQIFLKLQENLDRYFEELLSLEGQKFTKEYRETLDFVLPKLRQIEEVHNQQPTTINFLTKPVDEIRASITNN